MIKKFVFSLVVYCSFWGLVYEDVNGMNSVEVLVSDLSKKPDDAGKLTELVKELTDIDKGFDNSIDASEYIKTVYVQLPQKEGFDKLSCMVSTILSDWIRGNSSVRLIQYYVQGVLSGAFGPFFLKEDNSSF